MQIFKLFFVVFIVSLIIYTYGTFLTTKIKNSNVLYKVSLSTIFGSIIISLLILLINFFYPYNKYLGNIFLFTSLILFFFIFYKEEKKIAVITGIFLISVISSILLLYENINRPDAGLYHIPYVQIIHENKILLGISNIHFRFGHISIIQYLSAAFNNSFMPMETISAPLSIIVGSFYVFFATHFYKKNNFNEKDLFVFLISIYSFYSFNRYSNFGNDATSHLFFFLFLIKIFELDFNNINLEDLGILILISTFAFLQKSFMIFLLIICFIFYVKNHLKNLNFFKNFKIIISFFLIIMWLLKNIMVTGCLLYPISSTCLNSLIYTDLNGIRKVATDSEGWAKDWPNRDNSLQMEDYNKNFKWVSTWFKNHFIKIMEKLLPFISIISVFFLICFYYYKKEEKEDQKKLSINIYLILSICIFLSIIWFLKFPLYRYGQSFVSGVFISCFVLLFIKFVQLKKIKNYVSIFMGFVILIVISKNIIRIYKKYDYKNIWPNIYTLSEQKEDNYKKKLDPVYYNDKFIYFYSKDGECLYNKSPCSNFKINHVSKKLKYGYKIFFEK